MQDHRSHSFDRLSLGHDWCLVSVEMMVLLGVPRPGDYGDKDEDLDELLESSDMKAPMIMVMAPMELVIAGRHCRFHCVD